MTDMEREKWPDPVRRIKDEMDLHAVAGGSGYCAFNLQTGKPMSRGNSFPSRAAARRNAEKKTMDHLLILEIQPDGMPYKEANAVLQYERTLISAGVRTPDEFETEENSGLLSMPRTTYDRRRMRQQLVSGRPLMPEGMPYGNLPHFLRKGK
jgi:hypothetical protein